MKNKKYLLLTLIPLLTCCAPKKDVVKIFMSSNGEVNIPNFKNEFNKKEYEIEASYSSPSTYYYPFQYMSCRERDYDLFLLRDEEFIPSQIDEIFLPLNDSSLAYIKQGSYVFYTKSDVNYAIKVNGFNYKVNNYVTFEDGHDYYLAISKSSKHIGGFSSYDNITSMLAFDLLNDIL